MVWPMEQKIPGISKFPGKRTTGCQYIWFCTGNVGEIDRAWKTRLVVILIGRWKQWSLDSPDKRTRGDPGNKSVCLSTTGRWPPVPENFCYPACCPSVQCVHGVLAALLSKFQKRAELKRNLSSKRDMASDDSEMRWKNRYSSLLWFCGGIETLGMISTDLFLLVLRAWLKYTSVLIRQYNYSPYTCNFMPCIHRTASGLSTDSSLHWLSQDWVLPCVCCFCWEPLTKDHPFGL